MKDLKNLFSPESISGINEFNRHMLDNAPMSVMVLNKNGDIVFVNHHFEKISAEKQPFFKNIFKTKFFIEQDLCDDYKELLLNGKPFKREGCASSDKTAYINIVAVPLKNKSGEIDGALSMAIDVTEAVMAKFKLKKLNAGLEDKIAQKTKELVEINEKLERSMQMKSKFISDASHELRTPLAIGKLNLEFLKKQISNKEALEALNSVDNEINKISEILSDISFFTAIDENRVDKINIKKIELARLVEKSANRLKIFATEKGIDIIFKKGKYNPLISGDEAKLEKLFLNIIENSIKYGKKSGWVKIEVKPDSQKGSVKVVISDNGVGISKKDLPFIFDRFYRTKESRKDGEGGFGLGLSICKWIIDQHKGHIYVESSLGKGSVFSITFPALDLTH